MATEPSVETIDRSANRIQPHRNRETPDSFGSEQHYGASMRLGIGSGAFGVRGGISTRGFGVGIGPFSAGSSWRGRRRSGDGGFIGFALVAVLVFLLAAWPYLLGTYLAVQGGAGNPSTARSIVGWISEFLYVIALIALFVTTQEKRAESARERAEAAQQLAASGAIYSTRQGRSTAFRHGYCTINHRSHDTAARCRNT